MDDAGNTVIGDTMRKRQATEVGATMKYLSARILLLKAAFLLAGFAATAPAYAVPTVNIQLVSIRHSDVLVLQR